MPELGMNNAVIAIRLVKGPLPWLRLTLLRPWSPGNGSYPWIFPTTRSDGSTRPERGPSFVKRWIL